MAKIQKITTAEISAIITETFSDEEAAAGVNAESWFPLESQCPDADHYIHAYIVDVYGDITWENKPTGKSS